MSRMIFVLAAFIFFTSCKKTKHYDPENYIKCKINGTEWVAVENESFTRLMSAVWSDSGRAFIVQGGSNKIDVSLYVYDSSGLRNGDFQLNKGGGWPNGGFVLDYNKSLRDEYQTDSLHTGSATITFDKQKSRVSGTFHFKAKFESSEEVVAVTDGSFNMPCNIH